MAWRGGGGRIVWPILCIVPLVWLMVGCVYIPWFEHARLDGTKRDFRQTSGGDVPGGPLVYGKVTEPEVIRALGTPAVRSANGRVIVYTLTTQRGVWIQPLCLYITPGDRHVYALGLRFDANGILEHHRLAVADVPPSVGLIVMSPDGAAASAKMQVLQDIDEDNGVILADPWQRNYHRGDQDIRKGYSVVEPGRPANQE